MHIRIKALLFVLIRSFEFKLAVPADDIVGIAKYVFRNRHQEILQLTTSLGSLHGLRYDTSYLKDFSYQCLLERSSRAGVVSTSVA
jgi:hypothetical protein